MSNNPSCSDNVRPYIMIDVLNWKTLEKSYEDLCKRFGENAISEEDHQFLFNECTRKNQILLNALTNSDEITFNENKHILDNISFISDVPKIHKVSPVTGLDLMRNNEKFIRSCILYEVLNGEEMTEIYRKLENHLGKGSIDYPDFDYWYYRFKNGERDIDYDRDSAPRSPIFSELPVDAIRKIIEKLPLRDQLITRRVSKDLQTIIDSTRPPCTSIQFICQRDHIFVKFDEENLIYTSKREDIDVAQHDYGTGKIRYIRNNDFLKLAFRGLTFLLKNPKLQLESFDFRNNAACYKLWRFWEFMGDTVNSKMVYEKLYAMCEGLSHRKLKIAVKHFSLKIQKYEVIDLSRDFLIDDDDYDDPTLEDFTEKVYFLFTLLRSSHLKKISLDIPAFSSTDMTVLAETDQWKNADEVSISGLNSPPICYFLEFTRFTMGLPTVTIEELIGLRDTLVNSKISEYCTMKIPFMPDKQTIRQALGLKTFPDATHPDLRQYPIPGSNEILEFQINETSIIIRKKNCFTFLSSHFKNAEIPF